MKKIFLLFIIFALGSCVAPQQNPNFEKNVELTKAWFENWENEDLDYLSSKIGESIEWQGAFYANKEYFTTKEDVVAYISGWLAAMEDINYEPENFLPGVDPETSLPNGSVRTYGTWTGVNTASGKPFEVKFYHYLTFDDDGMLVNGGDYGDATGVVMAVAPDLES